MLVGNSIFGMAVKSNVFYGEVKMDNTAGIGSFNIPNPYQLNKMTLAMIKDKDRNYFFQNKKGGENMNIGSITSTVNAQNVNEKLVRSVEANESRKAETDEGSHDETHEIGEGKIGSTLDILA